MTWERFEKGSSHPLKAQRRDRPCVSRSQDRPDEAYLMLPRDMADGDRVSIYTDRQGRIAFEFDIAGDYAVRATSRTSYTRRITIPKALTHAIPFGLHDVQLERSAEGWLILDPQAVA
jgi:hypothetical protein